MSIGRSRTAALWRILHAARLGIAADWPEDATENIRLAGEAYRTRPWPGSRAQLRAKVEEVLAELARRAASGDELAIDAMRMEREAADMDGQEIMHLPRVKKCRVEGCGNPARARGVCLRCFNAARNGDKAALAAMTLMEKAESSKLKAESSDATSSRVDRSMSSQETRIMAKGETKCRVAGCSNPAKCRGVCKNCYAAWAYDAASARGQAVRAAMLPSARGRKPAVDSPARGPRPTAGRSAAESAALPERAGAGTMRTPTAAEPAAVARLLLAALGIGWNELKVGEDLVISLADRGTLVRVSPDGTVEPCLLTPS